MQTNFGGTVALGFVLAGFIYTGINAGKGSQRFPVGEPGHIADLGDELWAIGPPHAIDAHYCAVFRECGCQFIHFPAEPFHMPGGKV